MAARCMAARLSPVFLPVMDAERNRLMLESWQSVANDRGRIASAFYERLFEIDPCPQRPGSVAAAESARARAACVHGLFGP